MIEEIETLDKSAIQELLMESESQGYHYLTKMVSQWESGENRFARGNEKLICFKENEKVIGIGGINEEPYLRRKGYGRLRDVFVLTKYRRNHIGRQIVEHLIEFGKRHYKAITLRIPENKEAGPFYEAIGFLRTDDIETVTHVKWMNNGDKMALGLVGSPRADGSTASLIRKALSGLESIGYESKEMNVADLKLEYCSGCMTCETTRKCRIEDNFAILKETFWKADIVIIGSPSYWGDITGHLKVMFDRFTPYCNTIDGKTTVPTGKIGLAIAVRAGTSKKENQHIIDCIYHFYGHLGIKQGGCITLEGVKNLQDIKNLDVVTEEVKQLATKAGKEERQERPVLALKTGG